MKRWMVLRVATLVLAYAHTFPATKHIAAFVHAPSWAEAYKGFGALLAVCLYLLPVRWQARGLQVIWRRRAALAAATWGLAAVHAVPAVDHLPRFVTTLRWEDAWRGIGCALAVAWFLAPVSAQGRAVAALARWSRLGRGAGARQVSPVAWSHGR
jgi:hypothetical protein